ncbi:MAG: GntR family transcriptional regulator [Bacteroidales bacterium]|nr:GntR family transcriptional regulator [Bacteroidales bacterium]
MNFKESKPIYLQIADRIMDEILQKIYPEDGRIPSVREYAATVEVNANTVARSFDYLQSREIIYNRRGIGYFVSAQARATIKQMRKREFIDGDLPELFRKMSLLGISIDEIIENYKNNTNKKI